MDAIGDVGYMVFFRKIARVQPCKHFLTHGSVQTTYSIDFLGQPTCQHAHREPSLVRRSVDLTQVDKMFPTNLQSVGHITQIYANEGFLKDIVSCGNWCMGGK